MAFGYRLSASLPRHARHTSMACAWMYALVSDTSEKCFHLVVHSLALALSLSPSPLHSAYILNICAYTSPPLIRKWLAFICAGSTGQSECGDVVILMVREPLCPPAKQTGYHRRDPNAMISKAMMAHRPNHHLLPSLLDAFQNRFFSQLMNLFAADCTPTCPEPPFTCAFR